MVSAGGSVAVAITALILNFRLFHSLAVVGAFAALLGGLWAIVTRPMQAQMTAMQTSIQAQLNDIVARLGRIETKLDNHEQRITRLEERTSPLRH
jgi:F0F1-type ATP synthase membrane subunit b/b'